MLIFKYAIAGVVLSLLSSCLPSKVNSQEEAASTPHGFPISYFTQNNGMYDLPSWPRRYRLHLPQEYPISNGSFTRFALNSVIWAFFIVGIRYSIVLVSSAKS